MNAIFGWPRQPAKSEDAINLVLSHQEIQPFGVLGHNLVLPVLHNFPIHLGCAQSFKAILLGRLEMVIHLGVKQQGFRRDASHLETGPTQALVLFDKADLQAKLSSADSSSVAAWARADNGNVINGFWQSSAPPDVKIVRSPNN